MFLEVILNPDKIDLAQPHGAADGIPSVAAFILLILFVSFLIYISIKVWLSIKKDKNRY